MYRMISKYPLKNLESLGYKSNDLNYYKIKKYNDRTVTTKVDKATRLVTVYINLSSSVGSVNLTTELDDINDLFNRHLLEVVREAYHE